MALSLWSSVATTRWSAQGFGTSDLEVPYSMPCSRDKKRKKPKRGWYVCKGCGQARKEKDRLCEPKKVKK